MKTDLLHPFENIPYFTLEGLKQATCDSLMKNQYFGDVNDYQKYELLRTLANNGQYKIGVCWMLTADDGQTDGKFTDFLNKPDVWRMMHHSLTCFTSKWYLIAVEAWLWHKMQTCCLRPNSIVSFILTPVTIEQSISRK